MATLQKNPWGKLLAVLLLLGSTFLASLSAFDLIAALPYMEDDHWQGTSMYYNLLYQRQEELVRGAELTAQLASADLTYMDRRYTQDDLDVITAKMENDATLFRFRILSADGRDVLAHNLGGDKSLTELVPTVHYAAFLLGGTAWLNPPDDAIGERYIIECGVRDASDLNVKDEFSLLMREHKAAQTYFHAYTNQALLYGALALAALVYLLWTAGHRREEEGIALSWQEHIFFEVYTLIAFCLGTLACIALVALLESADRAIYDQVESYTSLLRSIRSGSAALNVSLVVLTALFLRTLTVRLKGRAFGRTTLIGRTWGWMTASIGEVARTVPFLWRSMGAFVAYVLLDAFLLTWLMPGYDWALIAWVLLHVAALVLLFRWSAGFQRLREGGKAMAAGNLSHQIDTRGMAHDLMTHAQDLNNLSHGMAEAVEEKMRSERFKAELITNVSHDLKTPLTSIINYVNLLKTTQQTDPKAADYIEVLDRKSQRLKKLTEDLVEASKASTGVLAVNREKISLPQLLDQALGEWSEKLEARRLTVVTVLPDKDAWVYADGRHLWRVIDNLLSNCAKYALEGTRVYIELIRGKGQITLTVKNISREPLNTPPERLMERFVRGEESRTTEGSGLGLSIARSLTELQGGAFELTTDGDLFKASITLPQAN